MAGPITIDVVIEIPQGSRNKYEYDHERHVFRLDRVLYSAVHYPADYGFITGTRSPDGDPLDALVLVHEPTFTGCLVPARAVGVLRMVDEAGEDNKILAVPVGDPRFAGVLDLGDLHSHWLLEIETFFTSYKTLETKHVQTLGWSGAEEAARLIEQCRVKEDAD